MRSRNGFTLVEALVSLVLFEIGILALVGSSAVTARDIGDAHQRSRARAAASVRIERMRLAGCPAPSAGRNTLPGGIVESWRIDAIGAARALSDSVEYPLSRRRTGRVVLHDALICAA